MPEDDRKLRYAQYDCWYQSIKLVSHGSDRSILDYGMLHGDGR